MLVPAGRLHHTPALLDAQRQRLLDVNLLDAQKQRPGHDRTQQHEHPRN
jgi:hypothetical protein